MAAIVLIPGLGFTARLFENVTLGGREVHCLEWIVPFPNESLLHYTTRLLAPLRLQHPPIVIGHSFGGIVAQTAAASRPLAGIILLSSIKSRSENPWTFRVVAPLGLHRLFTVRRTLATLRYWGAACGYARGGEQGLFRDMVRRQDDRFLQWALRELARWPGPSSPQPPTMHVHGTADRTFPFRRIRQPVHAIAGGTHLMVWNRASEVGDVLQAAIDELER